MSDTMPAHVILAIINVTAWGMLLGLPLYGVRSGSAKILCIGLYAFVFRIVTEGVSGPLAASTPLLPGASEIINTGAWQLVLYLPLLALAFPLGLFLNRFLAHSLEPFDEVVGFGIGILVAFIAVRTFLGAVALCSTGQELHASVSDLFLVRQCVALESWHGLKGWFTGLMHTDRW